VLCYHDVDATVATVPISLRDVIIVSNSYLTDGRTDGHWESNFVHLSLEM